MDDFSGDGKLEARDAPATDAPVASLAVSRRLGPREAAEVMFLLTWHFPNRQAWRWDCDQGDWGCGGEVPGNHYATRYRDAWDVAERVAAELPSLETDTLAFVLGFCESDLPAVVKEAALFNSSTLRTQTCFRTADGHLFGWEGCGDRLGCCMGTCTHVWNCEQATAFLFGGLARDMRETEFLHATDEQGRMSFRVALPLDGANDGMAAADGQMGCLMKLYRDWQLCGDDEWMRRLWPRARKALEFCWIPGGWDADRDGVMEGCQHNTMDVEYYGPNPQMGTWYLGALRAAEEMARYLGNEVMTGFEYTAAVGMLFEGESEDGLRCMAAVRDRYDGHRRNPFDEAECGHHYVRAMASWAAVLACSGFQYSARTKTLQFRSR